MTSRCRSCGARVRWVKTMHGKRHPLDAQPTSDGEWVIQARIDRDGETGMMVRAGPLHGNEPRYTSHFATCPNADSHRRGRR